MNAVSVASLSPNSIFFSKYVPSAYPTHPHAQTHRQILPAAMELLIQVIESTFGGLVFHRGIFLRLALDNQAQHLPYFEN